MPDRTLIDTSVWIQFFRKKGSPVSERVREYLKLNSACYTGPIVIELLQGAKTSKEIQTIEELFNAMTYIEISRRHYRHAGLISQKAAREGKIFSTIDMIIATVAHDENLSLFTLDGHFSEISKYCELSLITL
jgi:hypothetical protein